jgi:hypothetical protein
MTANRWFAIAVATLVWALALWFGFLALSTGRTIALATIGIGMVFALYALAGLSGAPDLAATGFRASLTGLGAGIALVIAFWSTGTDIFILAAPVCAFGLGAATALQPRPKGIGSSVRVAVVVVVSAIAVLVYNVDRTVYGLLAPLVVLPAMAIGDQLHERARDVVAEPTTD